jgi:SAM-dependent methyltransferase
METPAEVFDERYYRTVYGDYQRQNPKRKLRFYRDLLRAHLEDPGAPAVLDIGCAFGGFLGALPREWDRYGIDASAYAVAHARTALPGAALAHASLEGNPFPGPFDAITAFDVMEHIPNLDDARDRIRRWLKPGGIFVFVAPVYDGPLGWAVRALDKDPTHIHKTGRDFWLSWAAQSFDVLEWLGAYRYLTPLGIYLHFTSRLLRRWSPAIAVVAKRPR